MNLTTVGAAAVRDAALDLVNDAGDTEFYVMPGRVASLLGFQYGTHVAHGTTREWERRHAEESWTGRVRRALDKLADDGLIVKVKRDGRLPDGSCASGTTYYSHKAYAEAEDKAQARRTAAEVEAATWRQIRDRLASGPGVQLAPSGTLSLDDWLQLLEKAGW